MNGRARQPQSALDAVHAGNGRHEPQPALNSGARRAAPQLPTTYRAAAPRPHEPGSFRDFAPGAADLSGTTHHRWKGARPLHLPPWSGLTWPKLETPKTLRRCRRSPLAKPLVIEQTPLPCRRGKASPLGWDQPSRSSTSTTSNLPTYLLNEFPAPPTVPERLAYACLQAQTRAYICSVALPSLPCGLRPSRFRVTALSQHEVLKSA